MRDERLSAIDRADGFVTGDFAGVPEVALVLAEELLAAGDQETASGLALFAGTRLDDPAQARGKLLDAKGVNPVFAAKRRRGKPLARVILGGAGQGSQQS